jgi:glycosyltransferase involved in cell wall biosynthesis
LHTTIEPSDFVDVRSRQPDTIELLMVCRLVWTKRVDVAIRALEALAARGIEADLSIVGDGPDRMTLERLAAQSVVAQRIHFLGYVDPMTLRDCYGSAFAFVLPSETEGISLAIMEAMTAGVPVVATRVGGLAEFLRDGVDSLVVRPDPKDVAASIERLVRDRDLYVALASNAQKKMRSVKLDGWVQELSRLVAGGSLTR